MRFPRFLASCDVSSMQLRVVAMVLFVALLSVVSAPVEGRSHGRLGACDLTPQIWPAPNPPGVNTEMGRQSQMWPNGRFGSNFSAPVWRLYTGIMDWTAAPAPTKFYTLRSGDAAPAMDTLEYIPGGALNEIHLRVTALDRLFIGLMMYATTSPGGIPPNNTLEDHVGSWTLPSKRWYQTPASCGGNVVTHVGAQEKPFHSRFFFSAPVGTGTVRIRILLKQGVQNRGEFFYPEQELKLVEGKAPAALPPVQASVAANGTLAKFERVGPVVSASFVGAPGRACADVCAKERSELPFCDAEAIKAIDSTDAFLAATKTRMACSLPILAGCAFVGGPQMSETNVCTYRSKDVPFSCPKPLHGFDLSAPPNATVFAADVCFTAPAAKQRAICMCTNDVAAQPANPFGQRVAAGSASGKRTVEQRAVEQASAAPAAASSVFASAVVVVVATLLLSGRALQSSHRAALVLLGVLAVCGSGLFVAPVHAHNYFMSLHRASDASTTNPAPARIGNQPHAQVVPGQEFNIEWTNGHHDGHRSPVYFAILPLAAMQQLTAGNITDILEDFITLAPPSAQIEKGDGYWKHYFNYRASEDDGSNVTPYKFEFDKFYTDCPKTWLKPGDRNYIERPKAYRDRVRPNGHKDMSKDATDPVRQCTYKQEAYDLTARVQYKSEKYPWLESVSRFPIFQHDSITHAEKPSIARFTIPAYNGLGDYVVWFFWGGYMDVMDVNVIAPQPGAAGFTAKGEVVNLYGSPDKAGMVMAKVDHCEYRFIQAAALWLHKAPNGDASQCIKECVTGARPSFFGCNEVAATRALQPEIIPINTPANVPFLPFGFNDRCPSKCTGQSVLRRHNEGCQDCVDKGFMTGQPWCDAKAQEPISQDDVYCYSPWADFALFDAVTERWRTTTDPLDPAFYSTCWFQVASGGFINIKDDNYLPPTEWKAEELAVDCNVVRELRTINSTHAPDWRKALQKSVAGQAVDCDMLEAAEAMTPAQYLAMSRGSSVGGIGAQYQNVAGMADERGEGSDGAGGDGPSNGGGDGPSNGGGGDPINGGGADSAAGGSSSSLSGTTRLIIFVSAGVGALLLAAAVFFGVRWYRARGESLKAFNNMASAQPVPGLPAHFEMAAMGQEERLQPNPVQQW